MGSFFCLNVAYKGNDSLEIFQDHLPPSHMSFFPTSTNLLYGLASSCQAAPCSASHAFRYLKVMVVHCLFTIHLLNEILL